MEKQKPYSSVYMVMLANKAFGFSPDYTLWQISWPLLSAMFSELNYYNGEQSKSEKDTPVGSLTGIKGITIN